MNPILGSIVALCTPMHEDGSVDYDGLRRLVDWHVAEGTDCIGVVGTTGESPTVSVEEHCEIIRVSVEHAKGRVPIMAGTGHDRHATFRMLDSHPDDFAMLFDRHRRRFAGGADHADAVGAFGDVPVDQATQGVVIDAAVFLHRRDQRDDAANDGIHAVSSNPAILAGASGHSG